MSLPLFVPARPKLIPSAFDGVDFIFEVKMDGFRALAEVRPDQTRLVSRRGNTLQRFGELAAAIHIELDCEAVLDGEVVVLDAEGRSQFAQLFRRRTEPVFYAFDLLWLDGDDLTKRPLLERKQMLRALVPEQPSVLLFADHIEQRGVDLYREACERDLEGIVAKRRNGAYGVDWFKIRNPVYSQYEGRRELFERHKVGESLPLW